MTENTLKTDQIEGISKERKEIEGRCINLERKKLRDPRYPMKRLLKESFREGKDLILTGNKGMGKTYWAKKIANKECSDWQYTDKYLTNTEFYKFLFKNRKKDFIIIDDAAGFLSTNSRSVVMLKRALGNKELGWRSKYIPKKMETFSLQANLILISNEIEAIRKSKNFKAIMSRVRYYDLQLNRWERYLIFEKILNKDEMEILDFLKKYKLKVNIRDLNRYREYYRKDKNWKRYIFEDCCENKRQRLALKLSVSNISKNGKKEIWKDRTNNCWRTYQRVLKKAKNNERENS